MSTYFKALYKGEIVSKTAADDILSILELSQLNNRIPDQLPEGTKVIHKTGELSKIRHDAGIVYLEGHPYIIILLSKDLLFEDDGIETLSNISKAVFDYFSGR
jgi:beta-lactamase class A